MAGVLSRRWMSIVRVFTADAHRFVILRPDRRAKVVVVPSPDSDPDAAARDSPPQAGRPALSRRHFLALGAGGIVVAAGFGAADLAAGGPLRRIATKVATVTP